eukprot:416975_1
MNGSSNFDPFVSYFGISDELKYIISNLKLNVFAIRVHGFPTTRIIYSFCCFNASVIRFSFSLCRLNHSVSWPSCVRVLFLYLMPLTVVKIDTLLPQMALA